MDLTETGRFIKERRKQKNLTQAQLAEKLYVSEKTISKWECGKGFPDTSIMLSLCKELEISANELLSAKTLSKDEYKQKAENNLVLLQAEKERSDKLLLTIEIVLGVLSVVFLFSAIFIAGFAKIPLWAKIVVAIIGCAISLTGLHFCMIIEAKAGYYECQHCHYKHIPSLKQMYWSQHYGRTRYIKCPKCEKRSWQKKVLK